MALPHLIRTAGIAAVAASLTACAPAREDRPADAGETMTRAVAALHPTVGSEVRGEVTFVAVEAGVAITANITGLPPGLHGFHVHELGDCTAPDASSAGGHFNPTAASHGAPDSPQRHVGDLGNISADAAGTAHYERSDSRVTLSGPHSVIGRAVVVHAGADDLVSQPTGNAGARAACGVIGIAR